MARYWWQCISCGDRPAWLTVYHSRSIAAFIWDELAPSGWDQRLLRRRCECGRYSSASLRRLDIARRLQLGVRRDGKERCGNPPEAGRPTDVDGRRRRYRREAA
jgi:hypothetical protein